MAKSGYVALAIFGLAALAKSHQIEHQETGPEQAGAATYIEDTNDNQIIVETGWGETNVAAECAVYGEDYEVVLAGIKNTTAARGYGLQQGELFVVNVEGVPIDCTDDEPPSTLPASN